MKHAGFSVFLFLILHASSIAQSRKIDSLKTLIQTAKHDTTRINTLNVLAWKLQYQNLDTSILLSTKALKLCTQLPFSIKRTSGQAPFRTHASALSHRYLGSFNQQQGNFPLALFHYFEALKRREQLEENKEIANNLGNIGVVYNYQGDYPKALEYYFKALKIGEELDNKHAIGKNLSNIGIIYKKQNDYAKALEYYFRALKLHEAIGKKSGTASNLSNIGTIYKNQKDFPKALEYHFKALKIYEEIRITQGIISNLGNIGTIFDNQDDYPKALEYYFKALKLCEENGIKRSMVINLANIGSCYTKQQKYTAGERYLLQALALSKSIGLLNENTFIEQAISGLYQETGQFRKAYEHYAEFSNLKDSLFNEDKSKEVGKLEAGFEYDKKLAMEQAEHSKQTAVAVSERERQKVIMYAIGGGLVLLLVFFVLLINRFRLKQKANIMLKAKNNMIEKQRTNILDSISYAKRIQQSILVPESDVQIHLPESFIYYEPKDIVSGDFYWFSQQNGKSIIAIVDCTGHGVPGAFLSMIGNTLMNEIIIEKQIIDPAVILGKLHSSILNSFQHGDENGQSHDGMDMALCVIDQKSKMIRFSGAMNPLYVVRKGSLEVIKANLQSIGGRSIRAGKEVEAQFTGHEIPIEKDMAIYMFSDGYKDQFGGEKRNKFSGHRFKQLLLDNSKLKMNQQRAALSKAMGDWKGSHKQIDDMLVMGVK
ncbi:MAG: tetratricopeptide repeat protein, partial [Flavobacteriales bacterium]|nr:tetratricopeptide repeat protein [Flavobacteriales bacterium]